MTQQPFIVGITGGSGSGKTVFLKTVAASFSANEVCVISQDDYYYPREQQAYDDNGVQNFDLPSSFDNEAFGRDLAQLMAGKSIEIKEYVYNNETATPKTIVLHPAPIIIVEGIFVFHFENLRNQFDLKIFVNAPEELKIIRRIKRDQLERNYPLDDVLYRYENHVSPAFDSFIAPYQREADIIVNNRADYKKAANLVIGFLKNRINAVEN